jgi:4-carboxymuconolactone decarboxylase
MRERLERLVESDLDDEGRDLYRQIVEGPRASNQSFELRDAAGSLHGPFGLMLRVPVLGSPLQELGAAIRFGTRLGARERELLTLHVAAAMGSEFEWYAHQSAGIHAGLTVDDVADLRAGNYLPQDPVDKQLLRLCDALLVHEEFSDAQYVELVGVLGVEQVLEVIVLVGYYRTLAQMMSVFGIGSPPMPDAT